MPVIRNVASQTFQAGETLLPDANGVNVPNNANKKFRLTVTMTQAVLDDPATQFSLELWALVNSIWTFNAGFSFVGGPNQGKGGTATPNPGIQIAMAEVHARTVRGRMVAVNSFAAGLTLERLN